MLRMLMIIFLLVCYTPIEESSKAVIHYLLLVPWPDASNRSHAGWDDGRDLITGARVAVQEVNERTNLLNEYKINLIEAGHEACGLAETGLGLSNLVNNSINPSLPHNVVVILGLFCSTTTDALSPIAGREGVDLIQLSASNSPIFSYNSSCSQLSISNFPIFNCNNSYPHLWRFLQSGDVYVDMMIALMERFEWERVAIINDQESVFHSQIGITLAQRIESDNDKELVYQGRLVRLMNIFEDKVLFDLRQTRARIIFITASGAQIANILCKAAESGMLYPNYLWVIADFTLDLLQDTNRCDNRTLLRAVEGSIMSYFSLKPEDVNQVMINASNETYSTYLNKYYEELDNVKVDYNDDSLEGDPEYSSLAYDQVWAFSLALDKAIKSENISIEKYGFGKPQITAVIEENLRNISFQGASGYIKFSENHSVSTPINLFQVRSGSQILVGERIMFDKSLEWANVNIIFSDQLDDETPVFYQLVHPVITLFMIIGIVLLFTMITVILTLMCYYREKPEIKASSLKVSLLVFIGSYLFVLELIATTLRSSVELSMTLYSMLCNAEKVLCVNAYMLIFVTIFVKLQRIHHIFYNRRLKYLGCWYSNGSLAFKAIAGTCIANVILFLILLFQPFTRKSHEEFVSLDFKTVVYCYHYCSQNKNVISLWAVLYIYFFMFLIFNIYLASKSRNITQKQFKNTKTVNIFMVLAFALNVLWILSQLTLTRIDSTIIYFSVIAYCVTFCIAILCQAIQFLPKVFNVVKQEF